MISVLTVNYRTEWDLARMAESLIEHRAGEEVELLITNNSPGQPLELPDASTLFTRIIERPNLGYARGINWAAEEARGDILFIANPDVRIGPGVLPRGRAFLEEHPDVGIVVPLLRSLDGSVQRSVRRFYTWRTSFYARLPLRGRIPDPKFFRDYLMLDDDLSRPTDVDWGLGGAMFLRRGDYPRGRIFDRRFFLYFEDVDLCYRAWRRGRRVVYHPGLCCEHRHRRQSSHILSRHALHHVAAMLRFVWKHGGFPQRPPTPRKRRSPNGPLSS